ncbi:type IV secretory pathway TraG/TraD family ATPase VirD4 [Antricoccus suffuscus]|uniref:Type IV secretory pathway TraG/TraD family ATPase VirD4 n=2 Tax=Antricoccus suffuscus TaxID=1629062 RepID=A0A2T0ZUB1_9ACTN|nr:type IV secretory pathway TraG/TraD family ATPase VirD4 [Antricoccus suffuscus]
MATRRTSPQRQTTTRTRKERIAVTAMTILFLIGAGLAWSFGGGIAALLDGRGMAIAIPRLHVSALGAALKGGDAPLWTISGGGPLRFWIAAALVLLVVWVLLVVRPVARRARRDERTKALASPSLVGKDFSLAAVRKAGAYTRPDIARRSRAAGTEFGYYLGRLREDKKPIWVNFEQRVRIIARPGWGKTSRLLVPIARDVPGAALIGSVKADLFEQTVIARQARGQVRVVDFSDPTDRIADGYTPVQWDPIPGCEDLTVATRRARALVSGSEDGDREDNDDAFWRESARQVIEAWFHAAALAGLEITDVLRWQENIHSSEPKDILRDHPAAEPRARMALSKHLDDRAERTTSSVERFIVLALGPFGSATGHEFVGERRHCLDIRASITDHETIYLLASEDTAGAASPILTLFAEEWFYQARALAQALPAKRHAPPVCAVLDELRWLVPLPSLPAIAARDRAAGIGLVYAVQAMRQEQELYGAQAESLEGAVQVTIMGGFDKSAHQTITQQAGHAPVTSVSVGGGFWSGAHFTDSEQWRDVLTAADQQQLRDGESVIRIAGEPLMYAYSPSFRENRQLRKTITGEETKVRDIVVRARTNTRDQRTRDRARHAQQYRDQVAQNAIHTDGGTF